MLNPQLLLLIAPALGGSDPVVQPPDPTLEDKPVLHKWIGSVTAGAVITDGNTQTRSANATGDAQYRREDDRTTFGALWNYQDDKSGVLQRRTSGKAQYDYFFRPKTYGLAQTSAENDKEADLDLRWTAGVGVGQQFIENTVHKFSAEAGVSWVDENFAASPDSSYAAARGAYTFDWNINKDWVFYNAAQVFPSLERAEDIYTKVDTRLKVTLTEKMFAQAQWVMDWDNTPAGNNKRIDNRYILSIGWSF